MQRAGKKLYLLPPRVVVFVPFALKVPMQVGDSVVRPSSHSVTTDGAPQLGLTISEGPIKGSTSSILYVLFDTSCQVKY